MRKILIYTLTSVIFIQCKPFDPSLLQSGGEQLNPKLPAMEKQIENNYVFLINQGSNFIGPNPQDVSVLFDREISDKITNPYSDKKGYLLLKVNTIRHKANPGWGVVTWPLLEIPLLFGAATAVAKTNVEVQIDVLNLNRKLIGSYRGSANIKIKSGIYKDFKYKPSAMSRVSYIMAIKQAIQEAKKNMQSDIGRLNRELN
jgi:hypothetical protein